MWIVRPIIYRLWLIFCDFEYSSLSVCIGNVFIIWPIFILSGPFSVLCELISKTFNTREWMQWNKHWRRNLYNREPTGTDNNSFNSYMNCIVLVAAQTLDRRNKPLQSHFTTEILCDRILIIGIWFVAAITRFHKEHLVLYWQNCTTSFQVVIQRCCFKYNFIPLFWNKIFI